MSRTTDDDVDDLRIAIAMMASAMEAGDSLQIRLCLERAVVRRAILGSREYLRTMMALGQGLLDQVEASSQRRLERSHLSHAERRQRQARVRELLVELREIVPKDKESGG